MLKSLSFRVGRQWRQTAQVLLQQGVGGTTAGWLEEPQRCRVRVRAPEAHPSVHCIHFAVQPLHRWLIPPGFSLLTLPAFPSLPGDHKFLLSNS